jgi:hypothetical protein
VKKRKWEKARDEKKRRMRRTRRRLRRRRGGKWKRAEVRRIWRRGNFPDEKLQANNQERCLVSLEGKQPIIQQRFINIKEF